MNGTSTLADLLAIEADPELWATACPVSGVPYWHLIRGHVLRMIISDRYYGQPIPAGSSDAVPKSRMAETAIRSIAHNLTAGQRQAPVMIMATAVGLIEIDGSWVNRLADHFVGANPDGTLFVEDQFQWRWRTPRAVRPHLYHMPLQARCVLQARLASREPFRHAAKTVIALAVRRAAETVGFAFDDSRGAALTERLTARASELPHFYRAYTQMLKRRGTKILIKEEASYGGSAALMAAANGLGLVTVEYQHGLISKGHTSYNFAAEIRGLPALRRCLPQYLLTYGDWWSRQIAAPIEPVVIGNPHRDYMLAGLDGSARRGDVVLFLGDGIDTQRSLTMARAIHAAIAPNGHRLVFRPHPIERQRIAELARSNEAGVEVDKVADINAAMLGAAAVVGENSTGLFEAAGLANRTFVWDSPKSRFSLGEHPFETFTDAGELAEKLGRATGPNGQRASAEIWAPDWRQRYMRFLSEHGAANNGNRHP